MEMRLPDGVRMVGFGSIRGGGFTLTLAHKGQRATATASTREDVRASCLAELGLAPLNVPDPVSGDLSPGVIREPGRARPRRLTRTPRRASAYPVSGEL